MGSQTFEVLHCGGCGCELAEGGSGRRGNTSFMKVSKRGAPGAVAVSVFEVLSTNMKPQVLRFCVALNYVGETSRLLSCRSCRQRESSLGLNSFRCPASWIFVPLNVLNLLRECPASTLSVHWCLGDGSGVRGLGRRGVLDCGSRRVSWGRKEDDQDSTTCLNSQPLTNKPTPDFGPATTPNPPTPPGLLDLYLPLRVFLLALHASRVALVLDQIVALPCLGEPEPSRRGPSPRLRQSQSNNDIATTARRPTEIPPTSHPHLATRNNAHFNQDPEYSRDAGQPHLALKNLNSSNHTVWKQKLRMVLMGEVLWPHEVATGAGAEMVGGAGGLSGMRALSISCLRVQETPFELAAVCDRAWAASTILWDLFEGKTSANQFFLTKVGGGMTDHIASIHSLHHQTDVLRRQQELGRGGVHEHDLRPPQRASLSLLESLARASSPSSTSSPPFSTKTPRTSHQRQDKGHQRKSTALLKSKRVDANTDRIPSCTPVVGEHTYVLQPKGQSRHL
ncbi:hypothetical protein BDK51DRAFT_37262 [Blyttiomyces helicus]|uniref:Uncharacterized protein n=1 Tax=Blyttiomyces helicus TaxID=388810 RepID=A0A4P9W928_9FUNG|nr:hypothetical protein BDK51DRAFT_37262 [Blyttiomyces helicus]|eukprot:RKO88894.1 hypothetical protein BDK51DRAFT_37262 [Blyttiomyces helicus]